MLCAVDLYERLKPHLGEGETKALIEYVDEKIRGEVATKEDLLLVRGPGGKIQEVREELLGKIHGISEGLITTRVNCAHEMLMDDIRKCKVLVVEDIFLSPLGLGSFGWVVGMAK